MPVPVVSMKPTTRLILGLIALATLAQPATAQRRREQDAAYAASRDGRIMPLRDVERRVVGAMGGAAYLGPEYDPGSQTYRLKFMRGGSVIWVDVDARTGRELGRSGD